MPASSAVIALTDQAWFSFLHQQATNGVVDEANFWFPRAQRPFTPMVASEPVFLRLKASEHAIAGVGFFATFHLLSLDEAWRWFGWRNGDPDQLRFLQRIGGYRQVNLLDPRAPRRPLGCMILRDVHFWPRDRWIPWRDPEGWPRNTERGRREREPRHVDRLFAELQARRVTPPEDFAPIFQPLEADERELVLARARPRIGQGALRTRLLAAYGGRCAITGERTEPVLEAAHIQPYLGPRSNHVQNGLLLTEEFHTLYDAGYGGITPDHTVLVSVRLRADWANGHRYYAFRGQRLVSVPTGDAAPSPAALEWHLRRSFLG